MKIPRFMHGGNFYVHQPTRGSEFYIRSTRTIPREVTHGIAGTKFGALNQLGKTAPKLVFCISTKTLRTGSRAIYLFLIEIAYHFIQIAHDLATGCFIIFKKGMPNTKDEFWSSFT